MKQGILLVVLMGALAMAGCGDGESLFAPTPVMAPPSQPQAQSTVALLD